MRIHDNPGPGCCISCVASARWCSGGHRSTLRWIFKVSQGRSVFSSATKANLKVVIDEGDTKYRRISTSCQLEVDPVRIYAHSLLAGCALRFFFCCHVGVTEPLCEWGDAANLAHHPCHSETLRHLHGSENNVRARNPQADCVGN